MAGSSNDGQTGREPVGLFLDLTGGKKELTDLPNETWEKRQVAELSRKLAGDFDYDALGREGIVFDSAFVQASWTRPSVPTLLVLGERSWIPPYAPETGGLQVVRVPGGHSVLWDDPEPTADAIDAFL